MKPLLIATALIAQIFCFTTARAEEALNNDQLNSVTLEDLMHMEVKSSSKQSQKQYEAPGIVSVITREQFKDYGYFSLNDAVVHEPGFFPSHDFERHTIGSRGLFEGWNNNHLLLLVDGISFNDPEYGSAYTWENTPTFFIKSVEVTRGPGSALYGTNATNGMLAIQTLSGSDMQGRMEGHVRAGTFGTVSTEAFTGNTRETFDYFMGFNSFTTKGYVYDAYDASGSATKQRIRDDRTAQYMFFKADGKNDLKGLSIQYHDQQWRFQTAMGWNFLIPDEPDSLSEHRQILTASYAAPSKTALHSEFTFKFEHKELDWLLRIAPNGGTIAPNTFPQGVSEYLDLTHDNIFGRAQATYDLAKKSNVLAGVETSTFLYHGDKAHFSNTDLAGGTFAQVTGWQNAPDSIGLLKNKPLTNVGLYTQYMSGDVFSHNFQLTAGVRYDIEKFNYDAGLVGGQGEAHRSFIQVSPRLAAVLQPNSKLSYKILAGRAFRAPAPSELGTTSTWVASSSPTTLEPETVTNIEVGADYRPTDSLNWKINAYHTKSDKQIGYSANTVSVANLYTLTTAGVETSVNYSKNKTKSFANLSLSKRLDESINDPTIAVEKNDVTWAPSVTANIGATQTLNNQLKGTLLIDYLGQQQRRSSDNLTAANVALRGSSVPAFTTVDGSLLYQATKDCELNLYVKNIFNTEGSLIKNNDLPFDYPIEGRSFYASLNVNY